MVGYDGEKSPHETLSLSCLVAVRSIINTLMFKKGTNMSPPPRSRPQQEAAPGLRFLGQHTHTGRDEPWTNSTQLLHYALMKKGVYI